MQAKGLVQPRRPTRQRKVELGRIPARIGHLLDDDLAPLQGVLERADHSLAGADVDVIHRATVIAGGAGLVPAVRHRLRGAVARTRQNRAAKVRLAIVQAKGLVQPGRLTRQRKVELGRIPARVGHLLDDDLAPLDVVERAYDSLTNVEGHRDRRLVQV